MASVTSLDQDMRNLRLSRYTPQAANEVRSWIEASLGEKLPGGDLLEALKDGIALCKLANLVLPPPGIKFKKSSMPFMQMENISHFLRACEAPPLNLPAHDRFLTVDLYESKDPAQVLQCLGAFSRVAHTANPSRFPTAIGPKRSGTISLSTTSAGNGFSPSSYGRSHGVGITSRSSPATSTFNPIARSSTVGRAMSPALTGGSTSSRITDGGPAPSSGPVSSWSKRTDEGVTAPAWNIHQYGYMGGASQGNQGVTFGARRQITSAAPQVPSLAEKERKRREQEVENGRLRTQAEEVENRRRTEREREEEQERIVEEQRWEEESRQAREEEKRRVEQQKREWEEQERRWEEEEKARLREEKEALDRIEVEKLRKRSASDARLRGQYLSEYQAEQADKPRSRQVSRNDPERSAERDRVAELERQLEEAKARERQYELERQERLRQDAERSRQSAPRAPSPEGSQASWAVDEREYLRQQRADNQKHAPSTPQKTTVAPRPLPDPTSPPTAPRSSTTRPLPEPSAAPASPPTSPRPLPDPSDYTTFPTATPPSTRTDRFLATNPAPVSPKPTTHYPSELGLTSACEGAAEDARRAASQQKTKAGGWASKSLLEREMERERERQREWEEAQKRTREAVPDASEGAGEGQSWDVNQYGYTSGDSQNRGGTGIGFGGRRQIIGPRPRP